MKTIQTSGSKGNLIEKVKNPRDYSGRDLYVDIDVHKLRWQAAVFFDGIILSNTSIEASADALVSHLQKFYSAAIFIVCMRVDHLALPFTEHCRRPTWTE